MVDPNLGGAKTILMFAAEDCVDMSRSLHRAKYRIGQRGNRGTAKTVGDTVSSLRAGGAP
ncbi:MAG: hypothetical protein V4564_19955 [Pseudomonadota bacterium]